MNAAAMLAAISVTVVTAERTIAVMQIGTDDGTKEGPIDAQTVDATPIAASTAITAELIAGRTAATMLIATEGGIIADLTAELMAGVTPIAAITAEPMAGATPIAASTAITAELIAGRTAATMLIATEDGITAVQTIGMNVAATPIVRGAAISGV